MANNSLNRLPFFSALLANGRATVVFADAHSTIIAGGNLPTAVTNRWPMPPARGSAWRGNWPKRASLIGKSDAF